MGECRDAGSVVGAGIEKVHDDDRVGDDGLACHADEHDISDEGIVQFAEGVASGSQLPQGLGCGVGPQGGTGICDREGFGSRGVHLDGLDHAVAGDDQPGAGPEGVGEATRHRHYRLGIRGRRRCGSVGIEVETVDAAVSPHLFGFGGNARGGESLPGRGTTTHQPGRAAECRGRLGGERGQGFASLQTARDMGGSGTADLLRSYRPGPPPPSP